MVYIVLIALLIYTVYMHWKLGSVEERAAASVYAELKEEGWHKFAMKQERLIMYVEARDNDEMKIFKALDKNEEYTTIELDQIYETEMEEGERVREPGVYIFHNKTKGKYYVGSSLDVMQSAKDVIDGKGNKLVYKDYRRRNVFTVRMIPIIGSGYSKPAEIEKEAIRFLKADEEGYNK